MKLLDILNEGTEYLVKYTVLKDKDFSKGTASYENKEDAKKFFDDMVKDSEVISVTLRQKTGPDSSQDMMGGAMKSLGREEDIEKYTHPAWKGASQGGRKYDELTDQEKNIRSFLGSPSFISKKKGFTNKDGSDKYFEEGLEEGFKDKIDVQLMKLLDAVGFDKFADVLIDKFGIDGFTDRLHNAIGRMPGGEKILQKIGDMSALKEGMNEISKPTIVVYDGKRLAVDPKDIERLKSGKDIVGKSTKHAGQEEWIPAKGKWKVEESVNEGMSKSAIMRQIKDAEEILDSGEADGVPLNNETEMLVQQELSRLKRMLAMNETSLEEIYNQVSEAKDFGFFGNEEGKTGNSIVSEAFDDYEATVERAFQNLVNKVNTAINIGGSGGKDTEVREMMMYHFDKIQDKITTTDLINATIRK